MMGIMAYAKEPQSSASTNTNTSSTAPYNEPFSTHNTNFNHSQSLGSYSDPNIGAVAEQSSAVAVSGTYAAGANSLCKSNRQGSRSSLGSTGSDGVPVGDVGSYAAVGSIAGGFVGFGVMVGGVGVGGAGAYGSMPGLARDGDSEFVKSPNSPRNGVYNRWTLLQ